ncbi:MAG: 23S rRNA (uracil(1939)-C(5))-methyltransferase RlmD [Candidatus Hydrogenedentes bacterium]|nr:23S rRNA (uracil(1939)-C(5))-methyltransferase RlmD [Candidatus Hydrogenedentota bacterium]
MVVSPDSNTPLHLKNQTCKHFGDCGGCQCQDVPYQEQLRLKSATLRETFQEYWTGEITITPSPQVWRYRNRLDFNFGRKHYPEPPPKDFVRESALGFRRRGRWYWPVDIEDCLIGMEGNSHLLDAVRSWMYDQELHAYDPRSHEGTLRALLVREGKRTGQRMVVLITREALADPDRFVEVVNAASPATSIFQGIFTGKSDIVAADDLLLLHGSPTIDEELRIPDDDAARALRFRLSPFSFFQTNTLATERLYGTIRAWVRNLGASIVYDLYGGSGGIAFSCADLVQRIESVESVESATHDGAHNAEVNQITNVSFHTMNVEDYLRRLAEQGTLESNAAVILDPPRAGLHPKAIRALLELKPRNILYVSCKPSVLAQELKSLAEIYAIRKLWAVDLFPHTPHVEAVAWLQVKASAEEG